MVLKLKKNCLRKQRRVILSKKHGLCSLRGRKGSFTDYVEEIRTSKEVIRRSLTARAPLFDPRSAHVRFMVDKVAVGQDRLPVLVFSHIGIITPVPQASSNTTVFRRASKQNLGTFEQTNVISNFGRSTVHPALCISTC